uniref:Uncharacterized protein n=1 Tax=Arundo donax TaxID=35708 RepID=A0A0A8YQ79_ARUDO
MLAGAQLYIQS